MRKPDFAALFSQDNIRSKGAGPLYVRLRRVLDELVSSGLLDQGQALPTERDIAEMSGISRVTVRKAVDDLARLVSADWGEAPVIGNKAVGKTKERKKKSA